MALQPDTVKLSVAPIDAGRAVQRPRLENASLSMPEASAPGFGLVGHF